MKRRRRGGLDHVLNPELGLPHHPCHQANHPHTKILYIQLVSLLWRAGNPARNAPGTVLCFCHAAVLLSLDCQDLCGQSQGVWSSACVQCVILSNKSHWEHSTICISLMKVFNLLSGVNILTYSCRKTGAENSATYFQVGNGKLSWNESTTTLWSRTLIEWFEL